MLYTPTTNKSSTRGLFGVVTTSGPSGKIMRRLSFPVQTNTPKSVMARHIFLTAKNNYAAALTNGTVTPNRYDLADTALWQIINGMYFGIMQPGPYGDGVQAMGRLVGCTDGEAYYQMVQTNAANLGLPPLPAPAVTETAITTSGGNIAYTVAPTTLLTQANAGGQISPLVQLFPVAFSVQLTAYPAPPAHTTNGSGWWIASPSALNVTQGTCNDTSTLPTGPGGTYSNPGLVTVTAGTLPPGVTVTINGLTSPALLVFPQSPGFTPSFTASASATPGTYTVTFTCVAGATTNTVSFTLVVYSTAQNTYTLTASGLPAGCSASFDLPAYTPTYDPTWLSNYPPINIYTACVASHGTMTITASNTLPNGTYNFSLQLSGPDSPVSITVSITAHTCNLSIVTPPPVFDFPGSMGCTTVYDLSYNVVGFSLSYTHLSDWTYPATPWLWDGTGYSYASGANAPGIWEIYASDQYTDGYAPPDPSTWQPILFSGPDIPGFAAVLGAWQAAYGPLAPSGNIIFEMCYIDPATCASGPALWATAGWRYGSLVGATFAASANLELPGGTEWQGPYFAHTNGNPGGGVCSYDQPFATITVQGQAGYAGTITFSAEQTGHLATGTPPGTKALPANSTVTLTPSTLTIAPGDTTVYSATAAWNIPNANPFDTYKFEIKATDGIQTASATATYNLTGGAGPAIYTNFLTVGTNITLPAPTSPGQALVTVSLANTGPSEIDGEMLASCDDATIDLEYGQFPAAAASATVTTITFALPNSGGLNSLIGQVLTSTGYTPAAYNVTDATIVASTSTTATISSTANPGPVTTLGNAGLPGIAFAVPAGTIWTPGAACIDLLITVPGSTDTQGIQIQVEAYAGSYTNHSTLTLVTP